MERQLHGYVIVLASALLLGTLGMFSKLFFDAGGEPFTLLFLRFAGAGPALLLLAFLHPAPWPGRRIRTAGVSLGALQLFIAWALFEGFDRAPVSLVVLLFFVYPLLTAIGAAALFHEELGPGRILVLGLGMTGVALTVGAPGSANAAGIVFGLAAGFGLAAMILCARYVLTVGGMQPIQLSGLMFTSPLLVLIPWTAIRGIDLNLSAEAWAAALGAIVISVIIPITLFYTGVKLVGAGTASLLGIGEPLATVLLAFLVLGESLSALQLLGGLLIVAAVALLGLQARRISAAT